MNTPSITDLHDLGTKGIKLYGINRDPLTAHAAAILLQVTKLPLTEPQQNAVLVLTRQVEAYAAVHVEPL